MYFYTLNEMEKKEKIKLMDILKQGIKEDNIEKVKTILKNNPKLLKSRTRSGGTLLHDASKYGTAEMVKMLIEMGIDVTIESPASGNYGTALTCAGTPEVANILMEYGLKPDIDIEDEKNPLFLNIRNRNIPMIKFWIEYESKQLNHIDSKNKLLDKIYYELKIRGLEEKFYEIQEERRKDKKNSSQDIQISDEFEEMLYKSIKNAYRRMIEKYKNKHIYAFTLGNENSFVEQYFVANTDEELIKDNCDIEAKYFEENWGIWEYEENDIVEINKYVQNILEKIPEKKYIKEIKKNILDRYILCMKKLRNEKFFDENLLLNVYIREYCEDEKMIDIYYKLNDRENADIYAKVMRGIY